MTTPSSSHVIRLKGVAKRYGAVTALSDVTMEVPPGPVGLLGPNGAGKTTLIKVLLGLTAPSAGEAEIAGMSPATRRERIELRKRVGYMPESDCLVPGASAIELVAMLGRLTGMSRPDSIQRAHEVLDYVQLDESRYRPIEGFSTGMKQRLKLAQALVHDPPVLLLDEPTNGLDPKGRRHMLSLVEDLGRNQGKNVLLCSHLLPDVERTCDHVIVLDRGRVALEGAVADLTRAEQRRVVVTVVEGVEALAAGLARAGWLAEPEGREQGREALRITLPDADGAEVDDLIALIDGAGLQLESLEPVRSTLEQAFLGALGGTRADSQNGVRGARARSAEAPA